MKVTVKNGDINQIVAYFNALLTEKITIGTKSRIQKVLHKLSPHQKQYNGLWRDLILKYGGVQDGNTLQLPDPSNEPPEFTKEYNELSDVEFNEDFDLIDFRMIENIETSNFYDMILLEPFFENT